MAKTSAGCIIFLSLSLSLSLSLFHTQSNPFSSSVLSRIIMNVFCDHLRELSMITFFATKIFVGQKCVRWRNSICSAIMHTPSFPPLSLSLSLFQSPFSRSKIKLGCWLFFMFGNMSLSRERERGISMHNKSRFPTRLQNNNNNIKSVLKKCNNKQTRISFYIRFDRKIEILNCWIFLLARFFFQSWLDLFKRFVNRN